MLGRKLEACMAPRSPCLAEHAEWGMGSPQDEKTRELPLRRGLSSQPEFWGVGVGVQEKKRVRDEAMCPPTQAQQTVQCLWYSEAFLPQAAKASKRWVWTQCQEAGRGLRSQGTQGQCPSALHKGSGPSAAM